MFILAAAAGLFAGSYTYAMANPAPRHIPTAVVTTPAAPQQRAFVAGMEQALNASLQLTDYATYADARNAVDEQREFAVLRAHPGGTATRAAANRPRRPRTPQTPEPAAVLCGPASGAELPTRPLRHGFLGPAECPTKNPTKKKVPVQMNRDLLPMGVAGAGVEPATFRFSGGRSYQLSYPAAAVLTGFEPAASTLTGWRALQTAPQDLALCEVACTSLAHGGACPQRDSNPCYRLERAASWATRR